MNSYKTDYGRWLAEQISSLRNHNWQNLDIDNLVEELEQLNFNRRAFPFSIFN